MRCSAGGVCCPRGLFVSRRAVNNTMGIEQDIAQWDGKSAADIDTVYQRHCRRAEFARTLIKLLKPESAQKGATWLLKKYLDSGGELQQRDIDRVYKLLPDLVHWESKLHMLQAMPFMPIQETALDTVETFLRQCLAGDNKFVRAWAYGGFYELARQHPQYTAQTRQLFAMAMKDEAASVKARIRNLIKKGW